MKNWRSSYNFELNCDINQAEKIVLDYMNANGFKPINDNGESYYRGGDKMVGYRYFNYNITENTLTIYAWFKGLNGEVGIAEDGIGSLSMTVMSYRNSLSTLFHEIDRINAQSRNENNINVESNNILRYDNKTGKPIYEVTQNNNIINNSNNS